MKVKDSRIIEKNLLYEPIIKSGKFDKQQLLDNASGVSNPSHKSVSQSGEIATQNGKH